ncbi:twin-arginine translocation signal domain-containing protein [Aldersonia sp. NBC_00410]|uniref:phospholipase C n=1 Tax=Aldersonia sp. NBC_00410 TaxID=2975954 RepID=UPI00225B945B|nr:alkaline phosphatase family protein [Aldersonia sp. NBC_00410]MCX5044951.1 twin-arginine translocation signal domain-containing protein [Aldersonia sp. NBC_00410]
MGNASGTGSNRREFLQRAALASGAAVLASWAGPIIERAHAADPGGAGGLADIEHFVFLMQENRTFDHYFGTLRGVRGFDDPSPAWQQYGYAPGVGPTPDGYLLPFRLDTTIGTNLSGECINDPDHSWAGMHAVWNAGANNRHMPVHIEHEGPLNGPAAMGYYTRADIPVHYALADAFTICDGYHCSVLGPTDPNRLYWISATLDPDGRGGGPLVETPTFIPKNVYTWRTMPENLEEAGVSWKVYQNKDVGPLSSVVLDGMLGSFKQFNTPGTNLYARGIEPVFPNNFEADVRAGTLPQVSWIVPSIFTCEHPALPPTAGAVGIMQVLDILTSNPAVWEKTALIVSYDEGGGFFDHVTPPTAPPGTPGEYLTVPLAGVSSADGIAGPIGLGYRVPGLVISPYSRGGRIASEVFDHTSQLRLLETRFGVDVPNLTPWRRGVTGDMTSTFNFSVAPDAARPAIPTAFPVPPPKIAQCVPNVILGTVNRGIPYPVPPNAMPVQET